MHCNDKKIIKVISDGDHGSCFNKQIVGVLRILDSSDVLALTYILNWYLICRLILPVSHIVMADKAYPFVSYYCSVFPLLALCSSTLFR